MDRGKYKLSHKINLAVAGGSSLAARAPQAALRAARRGAKSAKKNAHFLRFSWRTAPPFRSFPPAAGAHGVPKWKL